MTAINLVLIILFGSSGLFYAFLSVLYIIGLWKMFAKSGLKSFWSLVPCARQYMLGKCAGKEVDGRVTSVAEFVITIFRVLNMFTETSTGNGVLLVFNFTTLIIQLVFSIRIYIGLCKVYDVKKRWAILWFFIECIPALVFGFSKKFNPHQKAQSIEGSEAPETAAGTLIEAQEGLAVNLEDRTVKEFFQTRYLLRDIHMYIKPGRMVLLLGGSGAGKTTFLNAVNGYEKANAKVTLNGTDVYEEYKKMQYNVGFVPQQELMRGKDTVYRTLMDSALLRLPVDLSAEDRKQRVEEVMDLFGLTPVMDNLVEKLSGGQKKRLSIAMEFISNPDLFILDEPDSGLDGVMARKLMSQLREIALKGRIVIVITHTPDRVIDLFDDVIVLAKDSNRIGRLAFYGTIGEAREFFGKERMEEIVKSVNRTEEGGEGKADEYITKYTEVLCG